MATPFPWDDYHPYHGNACEPGDGTPMAMAACLEQLHSMRPEGMAVRELGRSVEGRPISLVTVGQGPRTVLLWSQMHGDESTHTRVLLDLLSFLQRFPDHPHAQALLAGCTLRLIPLLNPDGAYRQSRHNAQDIDINRDARQLQTPEGRILKRAVERLRPDYAFNLHNQNARTTVSPEHRLAAVSLLVPPVDSMGTETGNMRRAKRAASSFCQAIAPHGQGMISRYDADFMPRSFGEAIQASGAATLLIEAGDWPEGGMVTLEQLHFVGLISTLRTIADDELDQADPDVYDRLPRSNEHRRFDLLIRGATLDNGLGHEPFRADLGINEVSTAPRRSRIVDLGDLDVTTGKQVVKGEGLICQPGRVRSDWRINPLFLPSLEECREWLTRGVTLLVGGVDLTDASQVDRFIALETHLGLPIDLSFVGSCAGHEEIDETMVREHLLRAIAGGLLGVRTQALPADVRSYAEWFQLPLIDEIHQEGDLPEGLLPGLGKIQREAEANLLIVDPEVGLRRVIVGGMVVFDQGGWTGHGPGCLLRRGGSSQ